MQELITDFELKITPLLKVGTQGITLGGDVRMRGPSYFYSTYDPKWQKHYIYRGLMLIDPVMHRCRGDEGMDRWSDLPVSRLGNEVFRRASRFNIHYGAVFVTINEDIRSFMSLARTDREISDIEMELTYDIFRNLAHEAFNKEVISDAEKELLHLLSEGFSLKEIARKLDLSVRGVEYRRDNLFKTLDVKNTAQAIKVGMRRNIID